MRKFPGWRTALAACAVAGLAVPATAVSASAGTGHDHGHFRPQVFIIHQEGVGAATGTVRAFGPVRGAGTDTVSSDSADVFAFDRGSVTVAHRAVSDSQPKLDFRACTATIFEKGRWKLVPPGTGKYENARSRDGRYSAVVVLYFRHKHHGPDAMTGGDHGRCRISLSGKTRPVNQTVDVFATGTVSLGGHR